MDGCECLRKILQSFNIGMLDVESLHVGVSMEKIFFCTSRGGRFATWITIAAVALASLPATGGAEDPHDQSAPENLAHDHCWDADGQIDLGNTYHIYHIEVELRDAFVAAAKGANGAVTSGGHAGQVGVSIHLLDQEGRVAAHCLPRHTDDGRHAQYACNGGGRRLVLQGPDQRLRGTCSTSVWGESREKAARMQSLAEQLYQRANTVWPACIEVCSSNSILAPTILALSLSHTQTLSLSHTHIHKSQAQRRGTSCVSLSLSLSLSLALSLSLSLSLSHTHTHIHTRAF